MLVRSVFFATMLAMTGSVVQATEPQDAASCAIGKDIDAITFSYQDNTCGGGNGNNQGSEAICEDCAPLVFFDPVTVECEGGELRVEPDVVPPGGTFTVSRRNGGALPQKIDCSFFDIDRTKIQKNIIDTSGDVDLQLQDDFGAFRVESCDLVGDLPNGELYVSADDGPGRDDANLIRVANNDGMCGGGGDRRSLNRVNGDCFESTDLKLCENQKYTFWYNPTPVEITKDIESVLLILDDDGVELQEICEDKNPYTLYANGKEFFKHDYFGEGSNPISADYTLNITAYSAEHCSGSVVAEGTYDFEVVECADPNEAVNP